ncbi:MAG: DUF790 family protein [Deltaproteobacteria bacterium]|nr:DUF790 family protein [Deltaproteobacteria bacterium]
MLTADLVRARRRGDQLYVSPLTPKKRAIAVEAATQLVGAARAHIGEVRESFEQVCRAIISQCDDRKLAAGLRKLVDDRCEFERPAGGDTAMLRAEVFAHAHNERRTGRFDRKALLARVGKTHGVSAETLAAQLYADLRGAHRLLTFDVIGAEALVTLYERQRQQAVLLRATKVSITFECRDAHTLRGIFQRLKFLQLLFTLEGRGPGAYALEIDGPLALFSASTRYGLKLALALGALYACDSFKLEAQLLWGKERRALRYELEKKRARKTAARHKAEVGSAEVGSAETGLAGMGLAEPAAALLERFTTHESPWRARAADAVLNLPGMGLVVPDLTFEREDGAVVHLEVLGFWSREAVWRRVDLVRAGLNEPLLFAVSERLRVSEAVLGDDESAGLLVFKGALRPKAVVSRLDALVDGKPSGK